MTVAGVTTIYEHRQSGIAYAHKHLLGAGHNDQQDAAVGCLRDLKAHLLPYHTSRRQVNYFVSVCVLAGSSRDIINDEPHDFRDNEKLFWKMYS